jgi:hypothetical protein
MTERKPRTRKPVEPEFEASKARVAIRKLEAEIETVAQAAALKAAQKQRGKITEILDELSPAARVIFDKMGAE